MPVRRWSYVSIGLGLTTALLFAAGCADEDPRFGGAGAIKNIQVFDTPAIPVPEAGAGQTPRQLFAQVYAALKPPCAGCHAPPGLPPAPLFFGADEETSYVECKARNYHLEGGKPPGRMYSLDDRGQHSARPVSDAERALIVQWRAAEKAAGATPTDAGGGG